MSAAPGSAAGGTRVLTAGADSSGIDVILRVVATVAMATLVALLTFSPPATNDFWLQAKIGELIVDTGAIPHTVLFPFTWARDYPFNAHEWLPSIAFHLADLALGYDRLLFVQGGLGLAQFALCVLLAFRLSRSLAVALMLSAMAMVVANYRYHLRPEIFALLFLVAQLLVLTAYRDRRDWRVLLWSAPIALLWANSHGSFLLGPIVCALFSVGEGIEALRAKTGAPFRARLRAGIQQSGPYALASIGTAALSLANPLGPELLRFALTLSASEVTKTFVEEWSPTLSRDFMTRAPFAIFVGSIAVVAALAVACWRRLTATDALLLLAFGFLAFQRTRFVALFGFAVLPVCARLIGSGSSRLPRERSLLIAAAGTAIAGVALTLQFGNVWGAFPYRSPSYNFSTPMLERLARPEVKGNVFNSFELGAELIYRGYPRLRPSIDSRIDSYGDRYFLIHENLLAEPPLMEQFIADFDVRYMLLLWRDFERAKRNDGLKQGWRVAFADHKMVLLERLAAESTGPAGPVKP